MNKILAVLLAAALFFLLYGYEVPTYKESAAAIKNPYEQSIVAYDGYARDQLDDNLTQLYDIVKDMILNGESEVLVRRNTYVEKDLQTVFSSIMQDSPDIFWVDWTSWEYAESREGFYLRPTYIFSSTVIDTKQMELDQAIASLISEINDSNPADDFDRAKYLHDYLIESVVYNENGPPEMHSAYGALVGKTAVCDGYAHAFQLVAQRMNLECYYLEGFIIGSAADEGHAWNVVKLDGKYYQIDVTWDDIEKTKGGEDFILKSYCYFLLSDTDMYADHTQTNVYTVPACAESYGYMNSVGLQGESFEDIRDRLIAQSVLDLRSDKNYIEFVITDTAEFDRVIKNTDEVLGLFINDLNEALKDAGSSIVVHNLSPSRMPRGFMVLSYST